jgi:endonuclease/exonuclease/phosphatase family metal-dependent hydrolase
MKTKNFAILISAAAMTVAAACSSERELSLMSYDVNNCLGMDSTLNVNRIAGIIVAGMPDVVALQQLDSMTVRFPSYSLAELAAATSMNAVYGPAAGFEGGTTGVGILSKEKPLSTRVVPMPGNPEEGCVMLVAEYKKFCFACVSMPVSLSERIAAVAIVKDEAARAGKPFFFGGSLNARFGSQTISSLAKDFTVLTDISAKTYPADSPVSLIDYLFMYNRNIRDFSIESVSVIDEPVASDHRPIVAKLSFR